MNCVNDQFKSTNYDTKLCDTYAPQIKRIVCTNKLRTNTPRDYVCTADLNSAISFASTQVQCLENDNRRGYFFLRTCVCNYTLQPNKQGWFRRYMWFIIGGICAVVLVAVLGSIGYNRYGRKHERVASDL